MSRSFLEHLATALGASPDAPTARQLIVMMQPSGSSVESRLWVMAIAQAALHPGTPLFNVFQQEGLLAQDVVADSLIRFAALHNNRALMEGWAKHPQAQRLAASERGARLLSGFLCEGKTPAEDRVAAFKRVLWHLLPWEQSTLDGLFREVVQNKSLSQSHRTELASMLLKKGADPSVDRDASGEKVKPAGLVFAHCAQQFGSGVVEVVDACTRSAHWDKTLALGDKGRSFAHILARSVSAQHLANALDRGSRAWWDGDPYGLLNTIVQNVHREPALLVYMCDRATSSQVEKGLHPASMSGIFSLMFKSAGTQDAAASTRRQFWENTAPRMRCLWVQAGPWERLCARTAAFEAQGAPRDEDQREAFLQGLLLEEATPLVQFQGRRRTL